MEPKFTPSIEVTYLCGAQVRITSNDPHILREAALRHSKRMCPSCQLQKGDITPEELDILMEDVMDSLITRVFREACDDYIAHLDKVSRTN